MITVYGAPPTRALRVIWGLEEMGLPYRVRPVDFATRFEDSEFVAISPAGALPAIRDGDVTMFESVAILEYLTARYGPTSLAPAPASSAFPLYQQFLHFGEASLTAPLNVAIGTRFFAPEEHKQNWGAVFAVDMVVRRSAAVARQLEKTPYVAGEDFTAADISVAYALGLGRLLGFADRLEPIVTDYVARATARPAYGRAAAAG